MKALISILFVAISINIFAQKTAEENVKELKLELFTPPAPMANYVRAVRTGNLLFLAGHGPTKADGTNIQGKVGVDLNLDEGYQAARQVGIAMLSTIKNELGDLNKVKRIVKVTGWVNCPADFKDQPMVMNGFSDLMVAVFGEKGKHARAALGANSLPSNISVEVEMIVEIAD
ncbi:MAG TPA: RidA family protein [Cyclobacteriaceae bacterium]|nr:RidA family protein [Cyclobacteriaceae bacterium]